MTVRTRRIKRDEHVKMTYVLKEQLAEMHVALNIV